MPVNASELRVRCRGFAGVLEKLPFLATLMPQYVASSRA